MIKEDSYIIITKLYILRKCYIGFTQFVLSSLVIKLLKNIYINHLYQYKHPCFDEIISIKFIILCFYIFKRTKISKLANP